MISDYIHHLFAFFHGRIGPKAREEGAEGHRTWTTTCCLYCLAKPCQCGHTMWLALRWFLTLLLQELWQCSCRNCGSYLSRWLRRWNVIWYRWKPWFRCRMSPELHGWNGAPSQWDREHKHLWEEDISGRPQTTHGSKLEDRLISLGWVMVGD